MSITETNVVDLIGVDPSKGVARLGISDHLEWIAPEDEHLLLLQEKINTYLRFIESGEIYDHYPDARNCKCEIELLSKYPLSKAAIDFCEMAKGVIKGAGLDFSYRVFS
ncbi:hypothetical protein QDD82_005346 [Burkholderia cepacia]|uniref:DUF6572 domain-containing protein n=1 Tax=Burkholderia cepacia complex TaxID=87882 RepID=UPI00158CE9F0|nr:DUF6572 domain-containing protein [Burkholderia cenocepacia]EKS9844493.1 hypothetical protein [Burkholderia cepacia]